MRLIDADVLMREFAEFVRASNNSDFAKTPTWNDAVSLVGSMPSAEPEIIHCKDCEYYHPSFCEIWSKYGTVQTREEGYCYMAERRTDEILDQIDREFSIDMVWTTEEVAEILARVLGDECACNFNGIDEWLPSACKYADTECPTPKEKHGCWMQFLMHAGRT